MPTVASSLASAGNGPLTRKASRQTLPVGDLAELWESDRQVRDRLRNNGGKMVQWVSDELINKPTMAGIALNCCALTHLANWWCKRQTSPKSPSVLDLKKEVNHLRGICQLPTDLVALHHDSWGVKKLFTYGVRKSGADNLASRSPNRREVATNPFFDELFRHWYVRLRPGVRMIQIEVEDSDDESTDFSDFIQVKMDPYIEDSKQNLSTSVSLESASGVKPVVKGEQPVKVEPATSGNVTQCSEHGVKTPLVVTIDDDNSPMKDTKGDKDKTSCVTPDQPTTADDIKARIAQLQLELAKRRASKFAMDNAETQPLPPSLSDAVASAGALALTPSPDHAGAVQEMMPTDDGCDDGLRRSLQRQFSAEEHLGVADGSQEATPVGGVADGSQEVAQVDHGLEGAVPDHELGLVPNPVEDQLGDLVAKADEAPMAACDALDQMPDHVPPSVEKELDCQLIEDAFVEK